MKLYYSPGACSLGIHVLLEEIGKPYDRRTDQRPRRGAISARHIVAVSPKAKVPSLWPATMAAF